MVTLFLKGENVKLFYLIRKNIANIIAQKKFTFFIVVFSAAIISYGILVYAGYLFYSYYDRVGDDVDKITVALQQDIETDEIKEIIEKLDIGSLNSIIVSEDEYNDMEGRVIGAYHANYPERIMAGKYYEKTDCENKMILPEYSVEELIGIDQNPIGKTVNIEGKNFNIEGIVSFFRVDGYEVPVEYYLKNYKVAFITTTYSKSVSKAEKSSFQQVLSNNANVEAYEIDCNKPALLSFSFWIDFIQFFIIFLLLIFNLFFILVFWLKSQRRKYNIYSVLGCSKGKLVMIMVLQNGLILFLGNLIGFILFGLTFPVLISLDLVYEFEFMNYAVIQLLFFIATMITLVYLVLDVNKENTMYVMKE